jgi:hypothetical protein
VSGVDDSQTSHLRKVECMLQLILGLQNDILGKNPWCILTCKLLLICNRLGKRLQDRELPVGDPGTDRTWREAAGRNVACHKCP